MTSEIKEFATTLQKTHIILKDIQRELGWGPERAHESYALLRVALHTLRDRLTMDQSIKFASQLPMLIRGFYFDGWNPHEVPIKMNKEEFLTAIQIEIPFAIDRNIEDLIRTVFNVIDSHLSPNEFKKIADTMPKDLQEVLM